MPAASAPVWRIRDAARWPAPARGAGTVRGCEKRLASYPSSSSNSLCSLGVPSFSSSIYGPPCARCQGSLLLHHALKRMLMFAGKVHHLRHFSFGDLVCVDAALTNPMVMNMQHDSGRGLVVLVEKPLQHMHDEFHRGVVVVQDEHTIKARPLGLRLGLGDDRGSRPRRARSPTLLVIVC